MDLLEFLLYICSTTGIWFGISVSSLHPNKWKALRTFFQQRKRWKEKSRVRRKLRRELESQVRFGFNKWNQINPAPPIQGHSI